MIVFNLLNEGNIVFFIVCYWKEMMGSFDEV